MSEGLFSVKLEDQEEIEISNPDVTSNQFNIFSHFVIFLFSGDWRELNLITLKDVWSYVRKYKASCLDQPFQELVNTKIKPSELDQLAAAVFINKLIPGCVGGNVSTDSKVLKDKDCWTLVILPIFFHRGYFSVFVMLET